MARTLHEVLTSADYRGKHERYSEQFVNKYNDMADEGNAFSLNLGNIERFDLIGCQGITGWSGSAWNSSSRAKNMFTKNNRQWQVANLASEKRNEQGVDVENTLTLLLGDNFYSDGLGYKKWFSRWNPATSTTFNYNFTRQPYGRSYAILGNHDWGLWSHGGSDDCKYKLQLALNQVEACYDDSAQTRQWNMPYRYYHFTTEKADFYCIDSSAYPYDEDQQSWLREVYDRPNKNTQKWQILISHHPLIGLGKRNPFNPKAIKDAYKYSKYFDPGKRKTDFRQQAPYQPHNDLLKCALSDFAFDVILSAHDHTLAGYYINHANKKTFQVVSGGGGAKREETTRRYINNLIDSNYVVADAGLENGGYFLQDQYGYVCMHVDDEQIDFDYYWIGGGEKHITVQKQRNAQQNEAENLHLIE
ncbi:metallophosphoesterase [Facilibium subflavum]|uniref:metallophosphoesterase n=1 Tax=Facilibium subflavum TaxID=2219058 RepID=UPI000E64CC36|nr:metallophosphoesterase [Facilibium subflavum]